MDLTFASAALGLLCTLGGAASVWGATYSRVKRTERDVILVTAAQKAHELFAAASLKAHEAADTMVHTETVQRLSRIEALLEQIDRRLP